MTKQPILRMQEISKSFFGVKVLDNVDLDLRPGEVMALIGENGAGKSTLIKILNGDYLKDGGSVYIERKAGRDRPSKRCGRTGHSHDLPGAAPLS